MLFENVRIRTHPQTGYIDLVHIFETFGSNRKACMNWLKSPRVKIVIKEVLSHPKVITAVEADETSLWGHPALACVALLHCMPPSTLVKELVRLCSVPVCRCPCADVQTQTLMSGCSEPIQESRMVQSVSLRDAETQTMPLPRLDDTIFEWLKAISDMLIRLNEK